MLLESSSSLPCCNLQIPDPLLAPVSARRTICFAVFCVKGIFGLHRSMMRRFKEHINRRRVEILCWQLAPPSPKKQTTSSCGGPVFALLEGRASSPKVVTPMIP